jgi:hypothetical protein
MINSHEIAPGIVYKDDNVTVKAFPVSHGDVEAFGFRLKTPDRTIVISGDTPPTQSVIDNCQSCDVLIHEAYSMMTDNAVSATAPAGRRNLHTSTMQLAELAGKAKPGLLIVYHRSNLGGVIAGGPGGRARGRKSGRSFSGRNPKRVCGQGGGRPRPGYLLTPTPELQAELRAHRGGPGRPLLKGGLPWFGFCCSSQVCWKSSGRSL